MSAAWSDFTPPLPRLAPPFPILASHGNRATDLRFVEVRGDSFEPVAYRGDFALVAPTGRWGGEGDYLVEVYPGEPALYRCTAMGTRAKPITMGCPNPLYRRQPWMMSRTDFEAALVGKVVAVLTIKDRALLRDFIPAI